ncbi:hypothetical protein [Spirosoma endbachense]|uniref:Tetratricopeptide repeat protein n=1 Tax=Spirosoma endbachense TaxID=2666025 RepID=A0A6P1W009_9BACT|nr:hypothetical protein [Spirosoma endbachense]QHV97662.1 hypothetical protein GJR95_22800 [Spirosoma endbachense]
MNSLRLQFDQLMIDVYRTNFDDAESKLDAFSEKHSTALTENELDQKVTLLRAEICEHGGKRQEALNLNLELWNRYSIVHYNYLPLGLTIVKLYFSLGQDETASRFVEDSLLTVSDKDLENYDPITLVKLLAVYLPKSGNHLDKIQAPMAYIEDKLEIQFDENDLVRALEEVDNRIYQEGQELTKILALAGGETPQATIKHLKKFIELATLKPFRQEAINFLNSL